MDSNAPTGRRRLQITVVARGLEKYELWVDLMDVPPTVNDLKEFVRHAAGDFAGRKVRVIEIMEGDGCE